MTLNRSWTATIVNKLGVPEHEIDDYHQEALIAQWQRPEITRAPKLRILDLYRGERYTGSTGAQGSKSVPATPYGDSPDSFDDSGVEIDMLQGLTVQAVRDAVKTLPEKYREVIFYRFYLDKSWSETAKIVGYSSRQTVETLFKQRIAPKLREALS
jgi:DNA-directed RNA polymerase specialized sigma24 family protein